VPDIDPDAQMVLNAWLMMGRRIDWAALPVVCDLLAVRDPEALLRGLFALRDLSERQH
jgi:hypothetical protein